MLLWIFRIIFAAITVFMTYIIWKDCKENGPDPKTVPTGEKVAYGIMGFVLNVGLQRKRYTGKAGQPVRLQMERDR